MNTDRIEIHCNCSHCGGRGTAYKASNLEGLTAKKYAAKVHNVVALAWSPLGGSLPRIAA